MTLNLKACAGSRLSYELECLGRPVDSLKLTLTDPGRQPLETATLEVRGDEFMAHSQQHEPFFLQLPFGVRGKAARARAPEAGKLVVTMPYAPLEEWLTQVNPHTSATCSAIHTWL